jgi:hypothetical protein
LGLDYFNHASTGLIFAVLSSGNGVVGLEQPGAEEGRASAVVVAAPIQAWSPLSHTARKQHNNRRSFTLR